MGTTICAASSYGLNQSGNRKKENPVQFIQPITIKPQGFHSEYSQFTYCAKKINQKGVIEYIWVMHKLEEPMICSQMFYKHSSGKFAWIIIIFITEFALTVFLEAWPTQSYRDAAAIAMEVGMISQSSTGGFHAKQGSKEYVFF